MEAMDDAGDWEARNFERRRLLYLRGMGFSIAGHEKGNFAFVNVVGGFDA